MKITDLKPNEVIHCPTYGDAVEICGLAQACKIKARKTLLPEHWNTYKEETCYNVREGLYADREFYKILGYTIHPSELFQDESDSSDEITEDGLMARGFVDHQDGQWIFDFGNISLDVTFEEDEEIYIELERQPLPAVKTLTDIDHLIRLLGV